MSSKNTKTKKPVKQNISNSQNEAKPTPKWFYLIALLIPILFFILLELGLRIFSYGKDVPQWIQVDTEHYMLNPDIAYRYFYSTEGIPYSSNDIFNINKQPNTFRVFVMGASSAAGFPSAPAGTFPRYINKRLKLMYPDKNIEMINVSMAAINTYALRDMLPGIIEQKPDLILFYIGHNEYYGALGVGSMESLGAYRSVINLMLKLNNYKTIELIRNTIKYFVNLFSSPSKHTGTLMARMAKDQAIAYNSNVYKLGIAQYEGNMEDMLELLKENNIPTILGTLTCNLIDQKPFISGTEDPNANSYYAKGKKEFSDGNLELAKEYLNKAKDLDLLRFRAPSEINKIITKLSKKYNLPCVDIETEYNNLSKNGIAGDNVMTDHLHPTVSGYNYIGKLYFEEMVKNNLVPDNRTLNLTNNQQDSITIKKLKYSIVDSLITKYRITILKNDWPYVEKQTSLKERLRQFNLKNYIDSLALYVVDNKLSWEKAHRDAATWYLRKGEYDKFINEMDLLIDIYPQIKEYYQTAYSQLLVAKQFEKAYKYLYLDYNYRPNDFNSKWLGIIDLSNQKTNSSIKYLEKSLTFKSNDPQVLFNLAGAYLTAKNYTKALWAINNCVQINPSFPGAQSLQYQIKQLQK